MITLLSDFGYQDSYVAAMKGAIACIAPAEITCDLTHNISPQDILAARFNLMMAYPYFPLGTVHLAVVDPGVGSARQAIALHCASGFFVGPDNGIFTGVLQQQQVISAVALTNANYWRKGLHSSGVSHTFHGRDIFAPAAAYLAKGVPIDELGDRLDPRHLVQLNLPSYRALTGPIAEVGAETGTEVGAETGTEESSAALRLKVSPKTYLGNLQYIDHFGNLISNLPGDLVHRCSPMPETDQPWQVRLATPTGRHHLLGIKTYAQMPIGTLFALVGSHGYIEIACNQGNAAQVLHLATDAQSVCAQQVWLEILS
ncbi:MAG: SAM-dependent chlorinase/fluorinase [Phormidesmis sp. RL_2_1]|nr:SAM-dependent chlorinase/fluorinase [Phormidesmis sp. RL_2_1]